MADEQTLATEVRTFFSALAKEPNRGMAQVIAETVNTNIGSIQFYQVLASAKANCDQLADDISASGLKQGSKNLYLGAVSSLAKYISIPSLNGVSNHLLRGEVQAFEYLTLVDDFLDPLDNRDIPKDFLANIGNQAQHMLDDLEESEIDPRLKAFLIKQVRQFIWSIQTFKIVGIEGLTRAWGSMAAEIARSKGMQGARKPDAENWYKRALPILGAIGLAVTSVSATVEQADNLLTHGSHIVAVVTGAEHSDAAVNKKDSPAEQLSTDNK
jgi:hypothetical protein